MKFSSRVCTDVGGTFTDLVYFETDEGGQQHVRVAKADTTPPNYEEGILNVLDRGTSTSARLAGSHTELQW